jgi:spore coat protein CotH
MTQNYYLYNDPDNSKLTWIPWDMNEALQEGKRGGTLELDFSNLESGKWPLIEYLYGDPVYRGLYDKYVEEVRDDYFELSSMQSLYSSYSNMIETYATSERAGYSFLESPGDFSLAVSYLNQQVSRRANAVNNYLDK